VKESRLSSACHPACRLEAKQRSQVIMESTEIVLQGKTLRVPSLTVKGRTIVLTGKRLRVATVRDESATEGELIPDLAECIAVLKASKPRADLLTFTQKLPDTAPKFPYNYEWDNVAAISIGTYEEWWKGLKDKTRNMVRKAQKNGVTIRIDPLDDNLVRAIMEIYNESPIRQGRKFWHYGKPFEIVKRELLTYLERAYFICAYWQNELIGFMKMVRVDSTAILFHFLSKTSHRDKAPMNALLAKAVEVCAAEGIKHLIYGRYTYGNKSESPLSEFKRHNGFQKIELPKYVIPLTLKGRAAIRLKLHRGILGILPPRILRLLGEGRELLLKRRFATIVRKPEMALPDAKLSIHASKSAAAKSQ
jgi:hypothetical protein